MMLELGHSVVYDQVYYNNPAKKSKCRVCPRDVSFGPDVQKIVFMFVSPPFFCCQRALQWGGCGKRTSEMEWTGGFIFVLMKTNQTNQEKEYLWLEGTSLLSLFLSFFRFLLLLVWWVV